ncbi:ankyrin repeat domain-containing protein SOWAHD [Nannospalax galili]|uniref:ankyrin repeat domain-containing protein SOWAHD n=1 Tax=Nannospalax galili TaxID=1026970 RepID=UPI0004ED1DA5|nr:ankyrin repeat domain-containing protein SOWAHD [Nannospalax galili]
MAEPQGAANQVPRAAVPPTLLNAPSALQIRPWRTDIGSLGRYRGHTVAATATLSREPLFHSSLSLAGASTARRREALRELLGLQGAVPAGWRSDERLEQSEAGPRRASSQGGSRMCLEPREHAWMLAAAEGRYEELLEMLEAEPGLLMRADPITGYNALHWLAKHGRHEELILLHDFARRRGLPFDVSAPGSGGLTPLHLAALQGHDMVIKVLAGALGADPTRRDHSGHRPCYYLRPNASQSLRELSGAEQWEIERDSKHDNANDNSTNPSSAGRLLRSTPSVARIRSTGTHCKEAKEAALPAKEKNGSGSQTSNGRLRHLFPFIQDR